MPIERNDAVPYIYTAGSAQVLKPTNVNGTPTTEKEGNVDKSTQDTTFVVDEFGEIEKSIKSIGNLTMQVAAEVPQYLYKGLIRYCVSPWDPIGSGYEGPIIYDGTTWNRLALEGPLSSISTSITTIESDVSSLSSAITNEQIARADADSALASDITSLTATVNSNTAAITTEQTTRADADTALASDITSLTATVNSNTAAITTEQTARADADTALASDITTVSATASGKNRTFAQTTAPTAQATGDIWIDTDNNNKMFRWNGSSWVAVDDARIAANSASITAETTARVDGDSALASDITTLEAIALAKNTTYRQPTAPVSASEGDLWYDSDDDDTLYRYESGVWEFVTVAGAGATTFAQTTAPTALADGDLWFDTDDNNKLYRWNGSTWVLVDDGRISVNAAAITAEQTARANGDSALASDITTLTTTVNGNTASITTLSSSVDGIEARYGVTLNAQGQMAGFELLAGGGGLSTFRIAAEKFELAPQAGGTAYSPFYVTGGVVYIDNARITGLTATNITARTISADRITLNDISVDELVSKAVTDVGFAQAVGVPDLTSSGNTTEITFSLNPAGGDVMLDGAIIADGTDQATGTKYKGLRVELFREATLLLTFEFIVARTYESGSGGGGTWIIQGQSPVLFLDTSRATTSQTYKLKLTSYGNSTGSMKIRSFAFRGLVRKDV